MNKIIKGKRYNTATSKKLGMNSSICSAEDPNWWSETLYQKQTGEYFLLGEGGSMTKYRSHVGGNSWDNGKQLIPLSVEEAKDWGKNNLEIQLYNEIFIDSDDDTSGKKLVTFSLSKSAINKLSRIAAETKITKSEIVDRLIKEK